MELLGKVGNGPGRNRLNFGGDRPTGRYSKPAKCSAGQR